MDNYNICNNCGSRALRFVGLRGLNMELRCDDCGNLQIERHPYAGLEEDLNRER